MPCLTRCCVENRLGKPLSGETRLQKNGHSGLGFMIQGLSIGCQNQVMVYDSGSIRMSEWVRIQVLGFNYQTSEWVKFRGYCTSRWVKVLGFY
jgi:hypothetical protein